MKNKLIKRFRNFFSETTTEQEKPFGSFASHSNYQYTSPNDILPNPNTSKDTAYSMKDYAEFLLDPHIYSCVQSRKAGALSMEWEINSGDTKTAEAEFIETALKGLDMRRIMSEMLDAPLFGFKPLEIYWKYDKDNRLVIADIIGKPQWWFKFTTQGGIRFMSRNNTSNGEAPPEHKILCVQYDATYTNPYGDSILAKCYYSLLFKKGGVELWSLYTQKFGMPFLHGSALSQNESDLNKIADALNQLQQDGSVATGEGVSITAIEAGGGSGGSADNYQKFAHFNNAEISKAILSQTLTTEQGETGAYAMSQTHLQVRGDVVVADAKLIENAFNKLIKSLIDLNFDNVTEYPKFMMFGDVEADVQLATRDEKIFAGGYCKPTKQYLTRHHNFKEDEIEMVVTAPPPAFSESSESIDTTFDIKQFDELTQKIITPILDMVNNGKTFEQIEKDIVKLYPEMNTEEIEQYLSKAFLIAQANGIIGKGK